MYINIWVRADQIETLYDAVCYERVHNINMYLEPMDVNKEVKRNYYFASLTLNFSDWLLLRDLYNDGSSIDDDDEFDEYKYDENV